MRHLFLLLLSSLAFSQFVTPPIIEIAGNNTLLASSLDNHYNASVANNSSVLLTFGNYNQNLSVSASIEIAGLSIVIDNATCPTEGLALLVVRGYQQDHLTSLPSGGYSDFICDYNWFQIMGPETAWRCDFDQDFCSEFENRTFVFYDIDVNFTFRNVSESVPLSSTLIEVPTEVLEEMRSSSGSENLTVSLNGNVTFIYEIDNRTFGASDCSNAYYNVSTSIPFSLNRSFEVAGENKLFFLRSPVLREQWFRNNQFNTVLLSENRLYYAEIYLNGILSRNFTLRDFYIIQNDYGIQEIFSNLSNATEWSENKTNDITPMPLERKNNSFSYVYTFNYSYDGLGNNNLALVINDSCLGYARYDDTFLSRMLSYNGSTTENGSSISLVPSRNSKGFKTETLSSISVSLGLLAFLFILAFVNFWLR